MPYSNKEQNNPDIKTIRPKRRKKTHRGGRRVQRSRKKKNNGCQTNINNSFKVQTQVKSPSMETKSNGVQMTHNNSFVLLPAPDPSKQLTHDPNDHHSCFVLMPRSTESKQLTHDPNDHHSKIVLLPRGDDGGVSIDFPLDPSSETKDMMHDQNVVLLPPLPKPANVNIDEDLVTAAAASFESCYSHSSPEPVSFEFNEFSIVDDENCNKHNEILPKHLNSFVVDGYTIDNIDVSTLKDDSKSPMNTVRIIGTNVQARRNHSNLLTAIDDSKEPLDVSHDDDDEAPLDVDECSNEDIDVSNLKDNFDSSINTIDMIWELFQGKNSNCSTTIDESKEASEVSQNDNQVSSSHTFDSIQEQLEQQTSNDISSVFDDVYCEEESVMPDLAIDEMNNMELTGCIQNSQPDDEPREENLSTDKLYKNFKGLASDSCFIQSHFCYLIKKSIEKTFEKEVSHSLQYMLTFVANHKNKSKDKNAIPSVFSITKIRGMRRLRVTPQQKDCFYIHPSFQEYHGTFFFNDISEIIEFVQTWSSHEVIIDICHDPGSLSFFRKDFEVCYPSLENDTPALLQYESISPIMTEIVNKISPVFMSQSDGSGNRGSLPIVTIGFTMQSGQQVHQNTILCCQDECAPVVNNNQGLINFETGYFITLAVIKVIARITTESKNLKDVLCVKDDPELSPEGNRYYKKERLYRRTCLYKDLVGDERWNSTPEPALKDVVSILLSLHNVTFEEKDLDTVGSCICLIANYLPEAIAFRFAANCGGHRDMMNCRLLEFTLTYMMYLPTQDIQMDKLSTLLLDHAEDTTFEQQRHNNYQPKHHLLTLALYTRKVVHDICKKIAKRECLRHAKTTQPISKILYSALVAFNLSYFDHNLRMRGEITLVEKSIQDHVKKVCDQYLPPLLTTDCSVYPRNFDPMAGLSDIIHCGLNLILLKHLKNKRDVTRFCVLASVESTISSIVTVYNDFIHDDNQENSFFVKFYKNDIHNKTYIYGNSMTDHLILFYEDVVDVDNVEDIYTNFLKVQLDLPSSTTLSKNKKLLLFHLLSVFGCLPGKCYHYSHFDVDRSYYRLFKEVYSKENPFSADIEDKWYCMRFMEIYEEMEKKVFGIKNFSMTKFEHMLHCIGDIIQNSTLSVHELLSNSELELQKIWDKVKRGEVATLFLHPDLHHVDRKSNSQCNWFEYTTENMLRIRDPTSNLSTFIEITFDPNTNGAPEIREYNKQKRPVKTEIHKKICLKIRNGHNTTHSVAV